MSIDEILKDLEDEIVRSAIAVIGGESSDNGKLHGENSRTEAKQSLSKMVYQIIGDDEQITDGFDMDTNTEIIIRAKLRREQRQLAKELGFEETL